VCLSVCKPLLNIASGADTVFAFIFVMILWLPRLSVFSVNQITFFSVLGTSV